jgi:hypothetical protein
VLRQFFYLRTFTWKSAKKISFHCLCAGALTLTPCPAVAAL